MSSKSLHITITIILILLGCDLANAQRYPERSLIRKGNKDYEKGKYSESEIDYRRALEKDPFSFEGTYNLGNALYKQGRFEEAVKAYANIEEKVDENTDLRSIANSQYNIGNSLVQTRDLDNAIEAYKNSLRINPDDQEAKFNLAYAKKLRGDNQDQDDDQDQDQDKNQDQNQDQNKDQNQDDKDDDKDDNEDNKDDQQDQDKDNQDDKDDKNDQNQDREREGGMSQSEAQSLLDALQNNEDKTREKVDEHRGAQAVKKSDKNW